MNLTDARDTLGEPYPGLRSFRRDETHIFFGREGTIAEMVDRLAPHRFLAVTGLSGSGKSSLVRTGLLNALERGLLVEAGSDWRVADFRPGGRPLSRMVAALVEALAVKFSDNELGLIEAKLARGPLGLVGWLDEIEFSGETNLLLLVDQFEEIFRYRQGPSGDDINAFVALLLASAKQRKRRIYVVITMRSDFLGDCARFTDLAETINDGQFLTPQLTRDQCREAIEGPAAVYDGRVEPALVTRMLNDMGGNPDQLPLMQHILMLLWRQARVRAGNHMPELTLADYDRLGGIGVPKPDSDLPIDIGANKPPLLTRLVAWVRRKFAAQPETQRTGSAAAAENRRSNGALSDHADRVLAKLTPAQQRLAAILFRALTQGEGTGGRDVRRPASLAQIAAIAEAPIADLIPVIEVFRAPHFITPPVPDPLAPDTMIDISHESLIRQWAKLRQWVRDEYQSAEEYRDIERAAKQWKNGLGSLLMKVDLAVARKWRKTERPNVAWAERYGDAFSLAMTFLRKSERHRLWRRGIAAVSASAVIVVVLSTTMFAVYLMAVVTSGLSYVNPAGEWSNFEVDPQAVLKRNVGTNTPLTIPGGRVIGTGELESALHRGTLEGVPFLAIDAWRRAPRKEYIPGSIYIEYAGDYGTFKDDLQKELKDELAKLTNNNLNMPLVFFCLGVKCWESYNAALRAINLGYSKVYWYRGGVSSWMEAKRQYPIDFSHIPVSFPGTITTGIRAISAFKQSVWPHPDYFYKRGVGYAEKQQYDNAIDDFTKAISLAPDNADAYFQRALASRSKEDYGQAFIDFTKAAALDPAKSADVQAILREPKYAALGYNKRGEAYYSKKDYDHAISNHDQAIKLDPNNATYHYSRGKAYYSKEDYDHAISDYDQAIKLDPNNADYYNDRGRIYIAERDYAHAVQDFSKAITLQPGDPSAYFNRARAELYWDKLSAAADDLSVVVKLLPTSQYAVIWLHIARTRAGENDASEFANTQKLNQTIWPGPIVGLFLGSVTPDAVRTAAQATDDLTTRNNQLCEADFYIGIYQAAKGDHDSARQSLQSAENSCPHEYFLYEAAGFELTRLH